MLCYVLWWLYGRCHAAKMSHSAAGKGPFANPVQSMWEERERWKFPLTARTSFCNPRSPLRDLPLPLHVIFIHAPVPLIQFSGPLRSLLRVFRSAGKQTALWLTVRMVLVAVRTFSMIARLNTRSHIVPTASAFETDRFSYSWVSAVNPTWCVAVVTVER